MKSIRKRRIPALLKIFTAILLISGWGAAFSGLVPLAATLFSRLALLPALLAAGGTAIGVVVLTALCGRFYCACICPLGIIQDLLRRMMCRKNIPGSGSRKWRMAISGAALGMWLSGSAAGILWLDPYSNFGRIIGSISVFSVTAGVFLAAILFFRPRWFCNCLCPAGTLLETAAHYPVLQLDFNTDCRKCRLCAANCPAGCIDTGKWRIDQSRCLRCMKCISVCPAPKSGISFRKIRRGDVDTCRREFLKNAGIFLTAAVCGGAMVKSGVIRLLPGMPEMPVLPPGAGNIRDFAARCTGCQLCVKNCPPKIIVPAAGGTGTVNLDLERGSCDFNCNRCSQICPAGAVKKLTLPEKQKLRIADAGVIRDKCVGCGECESACPCHAVSIPQYTAVIDKTKCIGCGKCARICPVHAIAINRIPEQITLG